VLFKLRVSVMVIVTAAAGLYLGDLRSGVNPFHLQAFFWRWLGLHWLLAGRRH